jgi:hypothetical protein
MGRTPFVFRFTGQASPALVPIVYDTGILRPIGHLPHLHYP